MSKVKDALFNRLDENPFAPIEADYYVDPQNLVRHFSVNVLGLLPDFFVFPNVLLSGGTGTGKTMLFRYLDFSTQFALNDSGWTTSPLELLQQCSESVGGLDQQAPYFVGVYLRLNDIPSHLLAGAASVPGMAQHLFKSYLDAALVSRLLMALKRADSLRIGGASADEWCPAVDALRTSGPWVLANDIFAAADEQAEAKREIDMWLQQIRPSLEDSPKRLLSGNAHVRMAEAICASNGAFAGARVLFMLDEYERLPDAFKETVNTLVRERPQYVHYKIGSRRYGLTTVATMDPGDHLQDGTDILIIDLEPTYTKSTRAYRDFVKDIAERRLSSAGDHWAARVAQVEEMFIPTSPEDAARRILENAVSPDKHRQNFERFLEKHGATNSTDIEKLMWNKNPLMEKLNMLLAKRRIIGRSRITFSDNEIHKMCKEYAEDSKKRSPYRTAYQKNRLSLVLQLAREHRVPPKIYAGFSVLARLSAGAPRTLLALLYESVERAKGTDSWEAKSRVSVDAQCSAAEKRAWDFLHDVKRVPHYGTDLYRFSMNMGAFLRALHLDELVRNPEPTYIGLTEQPDKPYFEVLVAAHMYSVLLSTEPVKPAIGRPLPEDHVFQPLLAPIFQLSYHKRGRTHLTLDELSQLIVGDEKVIGSMTKRMLSQPSVDDNQSRLELDIGFEADMDDGERCDDAPS